MPRLWTIPRAAMEAFENAARARFRAQARAHLAQASPARAAELGEEKMAAAIDRGIAQAIDYGILAERDIARFLELWFDAGFEPVRRWPWAKPILERPDLDGAAKMEFVQRMAE